MKIIILVLVILGVAFSETCGGNCPGGKCPSCPCGTTKNMVDIPTYCSKHTWNQSCCKCIASHESGGNSNAMNYNTNNSFDVGLFQINSINWPGCNSGHAPCNVDQNTQCAWYIYGRWGNSFHAWSTHTACGC
jgi:hypothetical protein